MRAHINCVENLPVYGAIVICATAAGARSGFLDALSLVFMSARICQTTVHLAFANRFCRLGALCILFRAGPLHGSHGNFGGGVSGGRIMGNGRNALRKFGVGLIFREVAMDKFPVDLPDAYVNVCAF
jgi:hypothetical protein